MSLTVFAAFPQDHHVLPTMVCVGAHKQSKTKLTSTQNHSGCLPDSDRVREEDNLQLD